MVGVPGRSKGCATCKKRKVRCDLAKPVCQNCVKAKRACEGYDKPLIFVHGLAGHSSTAASQSASLRPSALAGASTSAQSAVRLDRSEAEQHNAFSDMMQSPQLTVQFGTRQAHDTLLFESFLHVWAPEIFDGPGKRPWILLVSQMLDGTESALALSLRSLSLVRCARVWKDAGLIAQGRQVYGNALAKLQSELLHEKTMFTEEVMAACRIMSIYEFLESTSDGIAGWITHLQGMERVVYMRGPARFKDSLRSGALIDWRANAMIRSIVQRKASFLSLPKWHADTAGADVPAERLYDLGLVLGSLLEKSDHAAGGFGGIPKENDDFNLSASIGVTRSLGTLDQDLNEWYASFCQDLGTPFWVVPDFAPRGGLSYGLYSFLDVRVATFIATFWTIKLILSDAIEQMCLRLDHERRQDPALNSRYSLHFMDELWRPHTGSYRRALAVDIVRASPYCLGQTAEDPEPEEIVNGLQSAQRCLFTLGMAMRVMWRFQADREYARGALIFAYLMPKISFARDLQRRFESVAGEAAVRNPIELVKRAEEREAAENSGASPAGADSSTAGEWRRGGQEVQYSYVRSVEGAMTSSYQRQK